ncbi:hypothetical protein DPX16_15009 [Anabarilius grahami]|uniref:Uncharacterized protein n=1 Tax=Anabarilius grahami TaxID=495550 RepID=A0A3N0YWV6_ANAGA|nr:hypothetical protein DPX16_15009 [Anabarilius grahami]
MTVFFSSPSMGLCDIKKVGIPCAGTSPGRARALAREQEHAHQRAFGFTEVVGSAAQVTGLHEINNVTKELADDRYAKAARAHHSLAPLTRHASRSSAVFGKTSYRSWCEQAFTLILPQSNKLTIADLPSREGPLEFILFLNNKPIPSDGFLSQS